MRRLLYMFSMNSNRMTAMIAPHQEGHIGSGLTEQNMIKPETVQLHKYKHGQDRYRYHDEEFEVFIHSNPPLLWGW